MSADDLLAKAARKLAVLVLEDEQLIATLLVDWLIELGCDPVGPAESVQEALTLINARQLDAAILDVTLKREDSFAAAAALVERAVPFAFATGRQPDSMDPRFAAAAVILKPFNFDVVAQLVAGWSRK